jgi:carboxyl-terminal processing protease
LSKLKVQFILQFLTAKQGLRLPTVAAALLLYLCLPFSAGAQSATPSIKIDRERGQEMLENIKRDLKQHYYDENFRGMNVDARFKTAEERVKKAESNSEIFGIIAQVLADLNDSHTFFLPPRRVSRTDYGWTMQMIGDRCLVTEVKPGSDAEQKGLKVGDLVLSVDGFKLARENLSKFQYLYYRLKPRTGMMVTVQGLDGQTRELALAAKLLEGKELEEIREAELKRREKEEKTGIGERQPRCAAPNSGMVICKFPTFNVEERLVDQMMKKARDQQTLILDLRSNSGGREDTMKRLIGSFFDREVKVGDLKKRDKTEVLKVKGAGDKAFKGRLIVLVDSKSASAAEVFARVVQIEKRGTVIGDRSAGAVMLAMLFPYTYARGTVTMNLSGYAAEITVADMIMTDGKSLEVNGVLPDEMVLPTAEDLSNGWDVALSRALALGGGKLSPKEAAAVFAKNPPQQ